MPVALRPLTLIFLTAFCCAPQLCAQEARGAVDAPAAGLPQSRNPAHAPSIYWPQPRESWHGDMALGLSLLTVPRDIAEEELNKAPALDAHAVFGLPLNFSLRARAVLQVLTNSVQAGAAWSLPLGAFSASIGDDVVFCFGFMTVDGFDNSMTAWMNTPNISLGFDAGEARITVKGEGLVVLGMRTFAGENEVGSRKNIVAGWAASAVIEQPFWKNTHVLLGARLSLSEFHPQTWFAFSTFDRHLLFSELIFGVIL